MDTATVSATATDSPATFQNYARLALAALLIFLTWHAFRDELGYIPLLGDIDLAIHEFGHMLFMPFGILILGRTMIGGIRQEQANVSKSY